MPPFGSLLKKKKKDSTGGRDEATPKSPVKESFNREPTNTLSSESSKTAASTVPSQATTAVAAPPPEPKPNEASMNSSSPSTGPQIANLVNASDGAVESTPQQRQLKGKYTLADFNIQ